MSFLSNIEKQYKIIAKSPKLEETVNAMMDNAAFVRSLPDMIAAARAGVQVGHMQEKPHMVKFNALVLAYCEAIHKKDAAAALKAADALVKEGHGEAFGLK